MNNSLNLLLEFLREERDAFADFIQEDDYYHEDDDQDYDKGYDQYREEQLELAYERVDALIERVSTNGLNKADAAEIQNFIDGDAGLLADYLENAGEDSAVEDQILAYIEGVFK